MSFTTMNQGGQQDGGYGGGKSAGAQPLYKSVIEGANQTTGQMPGLSGQIANMVTNTAGNIMDQTYQGGPPKLDLSGMFKGVGNQVANTIVGSQQTPEQRVAESRAGGGILKLRQPRQPFNPNPTPNPGFGGGGGYGGGKGMPGNNPQIMQPGGPQYNPSMGGTEDLYKQYNTIRNRMTMEERPEDRMNYQQFVNYRNGTYTPPTDQEFYGNPGPISDPVGQY